MAFPKLSYLTKEFIRVPVRAERGGASYDPTVNTVEFALTRKPGDETGITPEDNYNDPTSWVTGSWDTKGSQYLAKVDVGGADSGASLTVPERGKYQVWIRVSANPETPVLYTGDVEFF